MKLSQIRELFKRIRELFKRSKARKAIQPNPSPGSGDTPETGSTNGENENVPDKKGTEGDPKSGPNQTKGSSTSQITVKVTDPETLKSNGGEPQKSKRSDAGADQLKRIKTPKQKGMEGVTKPPKQNPGKREQNHPTNKPQKPKQEFKPKPELICREEDQRINILFSVPSDFKVNNILQNGNPLTHQNNEYIIENIAEPIVIRTADNSEESISLAGDKYLIFKTGKNWAEGAGRQIKYFTKGFFIVIAPKNWNREDMPSVEKSACSDIMYLAHFFEVDSTNQSDTKFFEECKIPPLRKKIFLEGASIHDDSEQGLLYIKQPPKIRDTSEIVWVRVGEEGPGPKRWKGSNFKIKERSLEKLLVDRCGRFFIRVYNTKSEMIDSDEFRYCPDLREILVDNKPYDPETLLPPLPKGYEPSKLEFMGKDDQHLSCLRKNGATNGTPQKSPKAIEPFPDDDKTTWTLETERGQVEVVINLPRIWWRLEPSDEGGWHDKPIKMTRENFRSQSLIDTKIMLIAPSHIKNIKAGFDNDLDRKIPIKEGVPFTAFVHYNQIAKPQNQPSHLQIAWKETVITVLTIVADKVNVCSTSREPKLRPSVKTASGKIRQGKGFSTGEITSVDNNITQCRVLGIYVDRRRKTVHPGNIERLKGYINADDQ